MKRETVSHKYDLSPREIRNGTTDNYRMLAVEVLLTWARGLFYLRRSKLPEYQNVMVPYEYRDDKLDELERFPGSPSCLICEGLSNKTCWEVYDLVCEFMKTHERCLGHEKALALTR